MKILHLSTSDTRGGASIAAYRLHRGLVDNGIESVMFVQKKYSTRGDVLSSNGLSGDLATFFCKATDRVIGAALGRKGDDIISPALFSSVNLRIIDEINPDIVHLQWVCGGFLSPEKIAQIKKPIVWTMHDMWPFSGVNHYNGQNKSYVDGNFSGDGFLDKWTWERKRKAWGNINSLTPVSPSKWLADEAKASYLFKNLPVKNIPNGININVFKKYNKLESREKYNLPKDKKLILFGAMNPLSNKRKGYKLLVDVIRELSELDVKKHFALVVFGSKNNDTIDFGLPTYFIGNISSEDDLATVYSAADIFVAPSKEDNLPNTVVESMACGTPVVAFRIGGMPDMIDDRVSGIIVNPFEVGTMAKEIFSLLTNEVYYEKLSSAARQKILREFDLKIIVKKYCQLYNSILQQ